MRHGRLLSELKEAKVPWPQAEEVVKMKILSGQDRRDRNKGMRDLDDAMALLKIMALLKDDLHMTYRDDAEKAAIKAALGMFLPQWRKSGQLSSGRPSSVLLRRSRSKCFGR